MNNSEIKFSEKKRACPVCGTSRAVLFASEYINPEMVNEFSYSSRKKPEFMRHKLVLCDTCHCIYAPSLPDITALSEDYSSAAYDSREEAGHAARTYIGVLSPHIARISSRDTAVDVGAGNGALIPLLLAQGFSEVIGIEPSRKAILAAPDAVRPFIRETVFSASALAGIKPSLVCSFMTLEHLPDPKDFATIAYDSLEAGGIVAVIVHNWQGLINRMLRLKSPIIDIEHLQLFCPEAIETLLKEAGFTGISISSFKNTYPVRYWLNLTPLPDSVKKPLDRVLEKTGLDKKCLSIPVGNILAVGKKE